MYVFFCLIIESGDDMTETENVLLRVETLKDSFTKTEKRIASYVLSNPTGIIYMSLTELSDTLKVSEGSIVRFCQKIGFTGFHPFKIAVALCEKPKEHFSECLPEPEDLKGLKNFIAESYIGVIRDTSKFISEETLRQCVDVIITASSILLVGVGASGNTAQDAFYKFMRFGLNVKYTHDVHLQAMMASQLSGTDTLIAISQSGSTLETVDIAKLAHKTGAKVVSITGYERSPLAKSSDLVLLTPTRETPFESGAIRSKVAQLYVLELLVTAVFRKIEPEGQISIERTAEAVSKWIY